MFQHQFNQNKHLDFLIFNDNTFAKHGGLKSYPCYRTILCHALLYYFFMKGQQDFSETFEDCMNPLHSGIDNDTYFETPYFIELIPLVDRKGDILIDHSHGFYPLVLLAETKSRSTNSRQRGFVSAVKDLWKNQQSIIQLMNDSNVQLKDEEYYWTVDFQTTLQNKFNYPKDSER